MKKPKNIPTYYKSKGTPIYRDTTALPFLNGGPLVDRTDRGQLLPSVYASALGNYYAQGGMLKRADGSYSPRGLWDNIRDNAGSGKKPTKQMLAQEKKINKQYKEGGPLLTNLTPEEEKQFQKFYQSLPDNLMQDDPTYDIRGYWDSEGRPGTFNYDQPKDEDGYYHAYSINQNTGEYLKSPAHDTFQHAVDEDRKIGYRPITNVQGRNIAIENESIVPLQEQSFLANTQGPVNFRTGGQFPRPYSLPEDSFMQGGDNLHNSVYASSPAQYPALYKYGGSFQLPRQQMYMPLDHVERYGGYQKNIYNEGGNIGDPPKDAWDRSLNDKYYGFDPKTKKYTIAPYKIEELRKQAAGVSKYDPLYQKAIPSETTQQAAKNLPSQKKSVNEAMAIKTAEKDATIKAVKELPLLAQEQKNEILMDPRKLDEYSYLTRLAQQPDTVKESIPYSARERAWDIVTNPFDAFEYAVRTGDVSNMPRNYNQMRMAGIDPSAGGGANVVGNTLNTFTNLFDAGDKVVRNVGEGNYGTAALEAMRFLPGARLDIGASKYIKELPRFSNAAGSIQNAGRSVGSLVERAPSTRPTFTAQQRQNAELLSEWITDRNMPAEQLRDFVQRSPDWARLVDDYAAVTGNSQEINAFLSGMGSAPSRYTNPPIYAQADNLQQSLGRIDLRRAELPGRDQIASWDSNTFVRDNFTGFKTKKGPLKTIQTALTDLDKKVGSFIEEKFGELKKPISITDIEKEVNTLLEKGVGVKKGDFKIRIAANPNGNNADIHLDIKDYLTKNKELLEKTYPDSDIDAWLNTVPDGFVNSGTISVPSTVNPNIQNRTFTEILSGKPRQTTYLHSDALSPIETPGLRKKGEFPFNNWDPRIKDNVLNNLGVSGEYNKAINETLKSRGYGLYSGGTGHLSQGAKRYVKEFLNNRVDIANPGQAQTFLEKLNDTETMRLVNEALQDRTKKLPGDVEEAIQNVIFKYKKKGGYLYNNPNIIT
jgi:hypothetical protein